MPGFTLTTQTQAPVEEVWKLLFDPTRFPEWWAGVETVRVEQPGAYTMWPDGYPDFPMPQLLRTDRAIDVTWQLADTAPGTAITVRVELPEAESHRLDGQRELITASLANLSELAQGRERQVKR